MTMNLQRRHMPIRALGLQSKIICLVILMVACVLFLSSYLDSKLSEQAFEKDLRDQSVNLAQELAAGIAVQQILGAPDVLNKEIETFQRLRRHLLGLEVFLSGPQGPVLAASTLGSSRSVPEPEVWDEIREGRVSTSMERFQKTRIWKVTAPIRLQQEIVGAIRVRSSLANAQRLAARERRQSFAIMTAASVFIIAGLGWYLQHHVSQPIQTLVQTMAQAEAGDLGAAVQIARHDELGRLAASFNRMLRKIHQGYEDKVKLMARIENFNRELQAEVERATHELAARHEELRQAHTQFFELQRQLNRTERLAMAGQWAAMMAHDVSSPLNAISGHAQLLLQRSDLDAEVTDRLKIIEVQIARVVEVLQTLLTASAPAELTLKPIDPNQLVQGLLNLLAPVLSRKQVTPSTVLAADLPAIIGDAAQLQQVLLNCLVNALDAMPNGGSLRITTQWGTERYRSEVDDQTRCTIVVGQRPERTGCDYIAIAISDTGMGIATEDLQHIFEPFFTTKMRGTGTGLGLSICKRIVKAHGGHIEVESRVGTGTTLRIMLPPMRE
jgi:two-component system, NtrC family, sensor kinase